MLIYQIVFEYLPRKITTNALFCLGNCVFTFSGRIKHDITSKTGKISHKLI